jgi:flagellum-specific peptidoglycan hydrolase FlgJ
MPLEDNTHFKALPPKKQNFLKAALVAAQADRHKSGIPASVTVAQCILESGWGDSGLAVQGRNYFGIKAGSSWQNAVLLLPTKEYVGGHWITVTARWRKYDTMLESFEDHSHFLIINPRYKPCFEHKNDYKGFARKLQECGYATDPNYAKLLIEIIEYYGLQHFDFSV